LGIRGEIEGRSGSPRAGCVYRRRGSDSSKVLQLSERAMGGVAAAVMASGGAVDCMTTVWSSGSVGQERLLLLAAVARAVNTHRRREVAVA